MYQKKEYNTLRMVAKVTSGLGWVIVGLLALIGFATGWAKHDFVTGVLVGIIFAVAGIPLVVMGQMVSVFLDQKELLEEILGALKRT